MNSTTRAEPQFDPRHVKDVNLTAFLKNITDSAEEVLEQLEDRYDGAKDSTQQWLAITMTDQRALILALKRAQNISAEEGQA